MTKISPNQKCPCHSGTKYKKCCAKYHKGAVAPNAYTLMRSRYSAYALNHSAYIIKTTHIDNSDYTTDIASWSSSIEEFANNSFENLQILEWIDGEVEAFVSFRATISGEVMEERSRFLKVDARWLYVDGVFS